MTTPKRTKQEIADFVGEPYLISKEYSKRRKLHFHIVCRLDYTPELVKIAFRERFPEIWECKKLRGTTLKVDEVGPTDADLDQCSTYTVKDKDFIFSEFFNTRIESYVLNSYTKETPSSHIQRLLDEESVLEQPNWRGVFERIVQYKAFVDHPIYPQKIEAQVLGAMIKRNPDIAGSIVAKSKIFSLDILQNAALLPEEKDDSESDYD